MCDCNNLQDPCASPSTPTVTDDCGCQDVNPCIDTLVGVFKQGLNMNISVVGDGCDKKIQLDASEGGIPVDERVKVSAEDKTAGYLQDKVTPGTYTKISTDTDAYGNQVFSVDVNVNNLISTDDGNQLVLGTDGGLKTTFTTKAVEAMRACFDGVWHLLGDASFSTTQVTWNSGLPLYRIRFDGTVEMKGTASYTVNFGTYNSSTRTVTIPLGRIATTCLQEGELDGTVDLKNVMFIDDAQGTNFPQQYGYTISKIGKTVMATFFSALSLGGTKTIVIGLDGVQIHPTVSSQYNDVITPTSQTTSLGEYVGDVTLDQAGGTTVNLPQFAGYNFGLNIDGRDFKPTEYIVLPTGGFQVLLPDFTLGYNQRYKLTFA